MSGKGPATLLYIAVAMPMPFDLKSAGKYSSARRGFAAHPGANFLVPSFINITLLAIHPAQVDGDPPCSTGKGVWNLAVAAIRVFTPAVARTWRRNTGPGPHAGSKGQPEIRGGTPDKPRRCRSISDGRAPWPEPGIAGQLPRAWNNGGWIAGRNGFSFAF